MGTRRDDGSRRHDDASPPLLPHCTSCQHQSKCSDPARLRPRPARWTGGKGKEGRRQVQQNEREANAQPHFRTQSARRHRSSPLETVRRVLQCAKHSHAAKEHEANVPALANLSSSRIRSRSARWPDLELCISCTMPSTTSANDMVALRSARSSWGTLDGSRSSTSIYYVQQQRTRERY
jgi:hypothetical protein